MNAMHDPPHPGETLRDDVLPALGLTVTAAAAQLGVTRAALSRVLNARAGISPEMALRLERWLGIDHGARGPVPFDDHMTEPDASLHVLADERWARLLQSGKTVSWPEARAWIEARARGEPALRPAARKLRGFKRGPGFPNAT